MEGEIKGEWEEGMDVEKWRGDIGSGVRLVEEKEEEEKMRGCCEEEKGERTRAKGQGSADWKEAECGWEGEDKERVRKEEDGGKIETRKVGRKEEKRGAK